MTGLQRNADVVRLASYAPLLANESHVQWNPDAIWFDNDESWESRQLGRPEALRQQRRRRGRAEHLRRSGQRAERHRRRRLPVDVVDVGGVRQRQGDLQRDRRRRCSPTSSPTPPSGRRRAAPGRRPAVATCSRPPSVNDARSIVTGAYAKDWSNYTLELDATKLAGNEGFLVGFGATAPTTSTGGTSAAGTTPARCCSAPTAAAPARSRRSRARASRPARPTTSRSSSTAHTIELYLDGELQMTYDQPGASRAGVPGRHPRRGAPATSSPRWSTPSTLPVRTQVDVSDVELEPTGTVTTLTGAVPTDTNTKADPEPRSSRGTRAGAADLDELVRLRVPGVVGHVPPDAAPPTRSRRSSRARRQRQRGQRLVRRPGHGARRPRPTTASVDRLEVSVDGGAVDQPARRVRRGRGHRRRHSHRRGAGRRRRRATSARSGPLVVGIDADRAGDPGDARRRRPHGHARPPPTPAPGSSGSSTGSASGAWTTYAGPVAVGDAATTVEHRSTDRLGNVEDARQARRSPRRAVRLLTSVTAAVAVDDPVKPAEKVQIRVQVSGSGAVPTGAVTVARGHPGAGHRKPVRRPGDPDRGRDDVQPRRPRPRGEVRRQLGVRSLDRLRARARDEERADDHEPSQEESSDKRTAGLGGRSRCAGCGDRRRGCLRRFGRCRRG